jgi:hypothetical protein
MATGTARKPRSTQAGGQEQPEADGRNVDTATGEVTAARPYATVSVRTEMVPSYRGQIQVVTPDADGGEAAEQVDCPHARYGHESETAALKCAKAEAARRGLKVR